MGKRWPLTFALLIVGCGDPDCPDGTEYDGYVCATVDGGGADGGGTDGGHEGDAGSTGDSGPDAECHPVAETCNAMDDNCDGVADDTFECVLGQPVRCTTVCGSEGTANCDEECSLGACEPPPETCDFRDNDCDGTIDDGLASLTETHRFDPTNVTTIRIEAADGGFVAVVRSGGSLLGQRLNLNGTPNGTPVLLVSTDATWFDSAIGGGRLVVTWAQPGLLSAAVFDAAELSELVSPTEIVAADAGHPAVEASDSAVVFAYLRAGSIRTVASNLDLAPLSAEKTIRAYEGPGRKIDLLAPSNGSIDWILAYVSGAVENDIYLQRVRSDGNAVGAQRRVTTGGSGNHLLPVLADDGEGVIAVAWNNAETLELALHRQSDLSPLTSVVGGDIPPADFDVFRTHDLAYSGGRWVVYHLDSVHTGDVRARVFGHSGSLVAGSDAMPLSATPTSSIQEVGASAAEGRVMGVVSTDGQSESVPLGCGS